MFVNNKNVCMYSNAEAFNFSAFELRFTMDRRDSVTHICTILAAHVTEMCIHKLWEDVKDECSNVWVIIVKWGRVKEKPDVSLGLL